MVHQSIVARCIGPSVHRCQMHWGIVHWWQTALHSDSKMDPGFAALMSTRMPGTMGPCTMHCWIASLSCCVNTLQRNASPDESTHPKCDSTTQQIALQNDCTPQGMVRFIDPLRDSKITILNILRVSPLVHQSIGAWVPQRKK